MLKFILVMMIIIWSHQYTHNPPFSIRSDGYGESSKEWSDAITDALINLHDLANAYFVLSTGKYLNNWGAYGSCIDSVDGGTYWMVTTTGKVKGASESSQNVTYHTGLCVPKDCTIEDMVQMNGLFDGAAEFNNVSNPYVSYFSVTDYVHEQQGKPSSGEMIIGAIILIFLGTAGIGTLIHITKLFDKANVKENFVKNDESVITSEEYHEIPSNALVDPAAVQKEFGNNVATLYRKKTWTNPFLAFSAVRNAIKLVTPQKNAQIHPQNLLNDEQTTQILDGMKFYAMLWILYANTVAYTEVGIAKNAANKQEFFKDFLFTLLPTAYFASDVFFFISGFIAIYCLLKVNSFSAIVILKQYARRAYRLIPVMAFVLFTAKYLIPRFVEGPLCQRYTEQFSDCDKYFWTNLLLINNLYPAGLKSGWMSWTWYFSCDFQMFLLVPIIAVILQKSQMGGYIFTLVLVFISLILNAVLNGVSSNPGANPYIDRSYFTDIYIKPWIRAVPYYLGVYFGSLYFFYLKNSDHNILFNRIKFNPLFRVAMYILGFSLMFAIIFVVYDYTKDYGTTWSTGGKVVYTTLSSLVFILGLMMIILPALLHRAKLIRYVLTGPVYTLLGRSTYLVALTHPILMIAINTTSGQMIYIEGYRMFTMFLGHSFLIYLICVNLYLIIEGPIRGIESIWYDSFYANNMVENWIESLNYEKKINSKAPVTKGEESKKVEETKDME